MGMVNTESSRPFSREEVPMQRHAARRPSTKENASAMALVFTETQNGR